MLNRRTFLGAAVAATVLPAGEALAANPAPGRVQGAREFEAHETPEGVLYTVRDKQRTTSVRVAFCGPSDNYGEVKGLPPPVQRYAVLSFPVGYGPTQPPDHILPHQGDRLSPSVATTFSCPPSLEDVVAFHEACCADVPGRVIDAVDGPSGVLHEVRDGQRTTKTLKRHSLNPANRPVFRLWSVATLASQVDDLPPRGVDSTFDRPSLSDVIAFHERCCAEDGATAPRD